MSGIRKPTAIKKAEGNPGKRPLNTLEPTPDYLNDLSPPAWIPASAQVVWNELAKPLRRTKLLTEVDRDALGMTCVALAEYRRAARLLEGESLVIEAKDGKALPQPNPWLIVKSMAFKQAMKGLTEFGMTPRARTAIALQAQTDMFTDLEQNKSDIAQKYFN